MRGRRFARAGGSKAYGLATILLLAVSPAARAADATMAQPLSATSGASGQGVIAYPASFFASMGLDTAYDMVLRVPGFVFDDGSNLRGFASAAGNVLIDGQRPASKTDDLIGILGRIPAGAVERIDLIRGGAPGIDMQGKTVVVNVIKKKADGFKGILSVETAKPPGIEFDPGFHFEGTWNENGRIFEASLFAARGHDNTKANGPREIFGPDGQLQDFSASHNQAPNRQFMATSAYETPLLGGKMRVNLTLEDQPSHDLFVDDFELRGREVETDKLDVGDVELGQHYERNLSTTWKLEALGLEHLNKTDTNSTFTTTTDRQVFVQNDHGGEGIGRAILHWRASDNLNVDAGGEFAYNWLNTRTLFSDNGAPIQIPAGDVFVSEKRGEVFTTAVWKALNSLTIESGIRVEASTIASTGDVVLSKTLAFPKPRLIATWAPDAEDQLRLRVEREVGQLDFANFAANAVLNTTGVIAGNPNLSPQRDWALEAAYDRHFWTDGVVSLTMRHLILQDVVDRVPVFSRSGVFDEPGNIGAGRENDLVASFSLPLQRLGLDGAQIHGVGSWRFSRVKDPTTDEPREISVQHPLDAEMHFSQDVPRWKLTWGVDTSFPFILRNFRFNEIDRTFSGVEDTVYVDYKPRPDLTLRIQTDVERLVYDQRRFVFTGPRSSNPLQFIDLQRHFFGPIMFVRLRKTFG